MQPPLFDYTLCNVNGAPCVSGAFEELGSPGQYEVFMTNASTYETAYAYRDFSLCGT